MTLLLNVLAQNKNVILNKKLFPSKDTFELPSTIRFADIKKLALSIGKLKAGNIIEAQQKKEKYGFEINEKMRAIREMKAQLEQLEKQIIESKPLEFLESAFNDIIRISTDLPIAHIEFRDPAITIFTTHLLKKKDSIIGVYRIYIDWGQSNHSDAIRIKNVYKRYGSGNDHPCVSGGVLCQGSYHDSLNALFKARNLYGLLETLMQFIVTDKVSHGYVKQWKVWNDNSVRVNNDFEFGNREYRRSPQTPIALLHGHKLIDNDSLLLQSFNSYIEKKKKSALKSSDELAKRLIKKFNI